MSAVATSSSNRTVYFENGEQVYPCRCGETHRGDYAIYDYGHHLCFHNEVLSSLHTPDYWMCPACGQHFYTEPPQ